MTVLSSRLLRLYGRINASIERDLTKFPIAVVETPQGRGFFQDFSGGMPQAQILDEMNWLLYQIAHLRNDLFKWADGDAVRKDAIETAVKESLEIRICIDLSANDKHGGPRGDGQSGRGPRMSSPRRCMRIRGGGDAGTIIRWNLTTGRPETSANANAEVIFEAEIIDRDGVLIGYFPQVTEKAVADWEKLLNALDVRLPA